MDSTIRLIPRAKELGMRFEMMNRLLFPSAETMKNPDPKSNKKLIFLLSSDVMASEKMVPVNPF